LLFTSFFTIQTCVEHTRGAHARDRLFVRFCSLFATALAAPPYRQPAVIADLKEPLIVAGYRALFTCSAHFLQAADGGHQEDRAGRCRKSGLSDPVIDEQRKIVTASDPSGKIIRIAAFRDTMGCTILPPQWNGETSRVCRTFNTPVRRRVSSRVSGRRSRQASADGIDDRYRALARIVDSAFDGKTYGEGVVTTGVIILKGGSIVAERYRRASESSRAIERGHDKSISAALMASIQARAAQLRRSGEHSRMELCG
jgi:hypothetical protein